MSMRARVLGLLAFLLLILGVGQTSAASAAAASYQAAASRLSPAIAAAPALLARHAPLTLADVPAGDLVPGQVAVGFAGSPDDDSLAALTALGITLQPGVPTLGVYTAVLPDGLSERDALTAIAEIPAVTRVEPLTRMNWNLQPNDPYYATQKPYLDQIEAQAAWDEQPGNPAIVVAVLDSGIDVNQPDLQGRIWTNPSPGSTGCPGDVHGCNFVPPQRIDSSCSNQSTTPVPNGDVSPLLFHGTFVAGVLGANVNNGLGMAGIVRQATILPVRVGDCVAPFDMPMANGIMYAMQNGARVINLSAGGQGCDSVPSFVLAAIDAAVARGVVVVVSAGNDGLSCVGSPANYNGVIGVGASNGDRRPAFSQWGKQIAVVAPGVGIVGTMPTSAAQPAGSYTQYDGTSFAAPMVSGLAALLLSQNPLLSAPEVRSLIQQGATPLPDGNDPGWAGAGRIDIARSLSLVPQVVYGKVDAGGAAVADGTEVDALINGQLCAMALTYTAAGASWYELLVPPAASPTGCGTPGAGVSLYVDQAMLGSIPWSQGYAEVDLSLPPQTGPPS